MNIVTVNLPESYIQSLDKLVAKQFYCSRSEAIRVAINDLIKVDAKILEGLQELKNSQ